MDNIIQYIINRVDIELVNNEGNVKPFYIDICELQKGMDNSCTIKKSFLGTVKIEGAPIAFVKRIQKSLPVGIKIEITYDKERAKEAQKEKPWGYIPVYALVTPSQEYANERYKSFFSGSFQRILMYKRKDVMNELGQLCHPRAFVY